MRRPRFTTTQRGAEGECAFLWQAVRRGLVVAKPYGETAPYDFIVDNGPPRGRASRLLRVQVRSADSGRRTGWYDISVHSAGRREPLTRRHTDFIAAYVRPHHAWYIIPVAAVRGISTGIAFCPQRPTRSRWERFREAWHLLQRRA